MVSLRRTTACLANRTPSPPPKLSAQSDPQGRFKNPLHERHMKIYLFSIGWQRLHSSARRAWSLRSVGPSQRSSAAGGWWMSCLKQIIKKGRCIENTVRRSCHCGDILTLSCTDAVTVCTLNAKHLSYLQCSTTHFAESVDYSLSIGLWQERWVHQGFHVYKTEVQFYYDKWYWAWHTTRTVAMRSTQVVCHISHLQAAACHSISSRSHNLIVQKKQVQMTDV